jgi:hypothetical protein
MKQPAAARDGHGGVEQAREATVMSASESGTACPRRSAVSATSSDDGEILSLPPRR